MIVTVRKQHADGLWWLDGGTGSPGPIIASQVGAPQPPDDIARYPSRQEAINAASAAGFDLDLVNSDSEASVHIQTPVQTSPPSAPEPLEADSSPDDADALNLLRGEPDPRVWAARFVGEFSTPLLEFDEQTMSLWFAQSMISAAKRADAMPMFVGLCPVHTPAFYMPIDGTEIMRMPRCPIDDCDQRLVVYAQMPAL